MSEKKDSPASPQAIETQALAETPGEATPAKKHESVVDRVFDTLMGKAARGLTAAKRGLEATARWFDGRAKFVGDLAAKLAA